MNPYAHLSTCRQSKTTSGPTAPDFRPDRFLGRKTTGNVFLAMALVAVWFVQLGIKPLHAKEAVFDLDNHAGKVVYVDFWASWCGPCRKSFPFMIQLHREFGDDLVIAAINLDEKRADADTFLSEFDVPFSVFYDPAGRVAEAFDLKGMPMSFLFGRQGEKLGQHVGFRKKDEEKLRAAIKTALGR
jgi:thiol-disulfide isomerase/thioredoxin